LGFKKLELLRGEEWIADIYTEKPRVIHPRSQHQDQTGVTELGLSKSPNWIAILGYELSVTEEKHSGTKLYN
jgi:hypothetical protein